MPAHARPAPAGGLGDDALRVYEALLSRPGTSTRELGDRVGLSEEKVGAALAALRRGGLVHGPDVTPAAAPPDVALEELLAAHYARLAEESAQIAQIRRHLAGMVDVSRRADDGDPYFEVVRGLDGIQGRLAELTVRCREELLCMVPSATRTLATSSAPLMTTNRDAAERGVSLRTLLPNAVADDPDGWAYARELIAIGDDVRTCPSIGQIANIFDARTAMVPLDAGNSRGGAVIVTNTTLVSGLVALFDQLWATSLPITPTGPADPLDARDRQILELLLRGAKDEQVARTLSLSVRTVRARVAALQARAGARSRFQLAAVALHHGWITAGS